MPDSCHRKQRRKSSNGPQIPLAGSRKRSSTGSSPGNLELALCHSGLSRIRRNPSGYWRYEGTPISIIYAIVRYSQKFEYVDSWRVDTERAQEDGQEKIYNTCLVINPEGAVVAKHRKVHLFDIDVPGGIRFFESETLSPGQTVSHFSSPFGEIGVGICYDIRFAELALLMRQKYKCTILVYPGAFNMTTGPAHWEILQRARALDNQCFVLTASPARTSPPENSADSKYPHYTAWGHSTVISPWGDIVATTDEKEGIVVADLDLARVDEIRRSIPIGDQRRSDMYELEAKK